MAGPKCWVSVEAGQRHEHRQRSPSVNEQGVPHPFFVVPPSLLLRFIGPGSFLSPAVLRPCHSQKITIWIDDKALHVHCSHACSWRSRPPIASLPRSDPRKPQSSIEQHFVLLSIRYTLRTHITFPFQAAAGLSPFITRCLM